MGESHAQKKEERGGKCRDYVLN